MTGPRECSADSANGSLPSARYGWYLVLVLMICYTLSFVDRQILGLLVGPIEHDLHIRDTRMGLLQGFAFVFFYTLVGIPIGRLVDLGNRRTLVSACILVWSAMTSLCAAAGSFVSLFAARVGVGIGEAGLSPAAFSMISDCFARARLSKAISVYTMGIFIGSGLAMIVGGSVIQAASHMAPVQLPWLGLVAPWRLTFLMVGGPGVLVAVWVLTLREPLRRQQLKDHSGAVRRFSARQIGQQILLRWRSFFGLALGMIFQSMVTYAFTSWGPTYFQRLHQWSPQRTGLTLGVVTLVFGCLGMFAGGTLSDYWKRRGAADAALKVLILAGSGTGLCFVAAFLMPDPRLTVLLLAPALFFEGMPVGSAFAAVQLIFPNQLRGAVSALFMFLLNLGGQIIGPLMPALLDDYVFHSQQQLGVSLAITQAVAAVGMVVLFAATRGAYRRDYLALENQTLDAPETAI